MRAEAAEENTGDDIEMSPGEADLGSAGLGTSRIQDAVNLRPRNRHILKGIGDEKVAQSATTHQAQIYEPRGNGRWQRWNWNGQHAIDTPYQVRRFFGSEVNLRNGTEVDANHCAIVSTGVATP